MKKIILLMIAMALLCAGCDFNTSVKVFTIDLEKIMSSTDAAKARDEHMKKVHQVLQSGMNDLEAKVKDTPKEQMQAQLVEAQRVLQTQLNRERTTANQVVHALMVDAVKAWRVANQKQSIVVVKQILVDADVSFDITDQIIVAMNAGKKPTFADLPSVKIREEEAKAPESEAKPAPVTPAPAKRQRRNRGTSYQTPIQPAQPATPAPAPATPEGN